MDNRKSVFRQVKRRDFLKGVSLLAASTAVTGSFIKSQAGSAIAKVPTTPTGKDFALRAYQVRVKSAKAISSEMPEHSTNGDEAKYANKIASDTRGLPHNQRGEVDLKAYQTYINALKSGNPDDFEAIVLGGTQKIPQPLGALAVSLTGLNASQIAIPAPPTLESAEQAVEYIEIAWQALLKDVPFSEYRNDTNHPLILAAAKELNQHSAYRGAKEKGRITPQTLLRGSANYLTAKGTSTTSPPGVNVGPYISQFLLLSVPLGLQYIVQQNRIPAATDENSFLVNYDEWLALQNGGSTDRKIKFDSTRRYLLNQRDLAQLVNATPPVYINAAWILLTKPDPSDPLSGGIGAPYSPSNPYNKSKTQSGGVATFGGAYVRALVAAIAPYAVRSAYWQKYYVHRRLRPEAFAGLIHNNRVNQTNYPLHKDVFSSEAIDRLFSTNKTYLLPQAYPVGSPFYSSYTGGAAAIAGASVTILKAMFDENFVIPNPVMVDPNDPTKLIPYKGEPLTVGGELNKLATNIGQGRAAAGIHWRSDTAAGLVQGEAIAISILNDEKRTFREKFEGFTFTKFDGTKVEI